MSQFNPPPMRGQRNTFSAACDSLGVENNTPAWPDRFGEALKTWLEDNKIPPIRTLSLFSGAGGLDIGFADVGFDIAASVEIEEKFCETLELNTGAGKRFPNSRVHCADIRRFSGKDLGPIDFMIGGPPCQAFSAAGRRANGAPGTADARGVLFREYVRLLEALSPKGFLFENVDGIIGTQGGRAWEEIRQAFSDAGYQLYYRILDAAGYGVPQHRERLIIVGLKKGAFRFPRPTHGPDSIDKGPFYNAETAVEGVVSRETDEANRLGGRYAPLLEAIPPGLNYSFYTEKMGHPTPLFAWRSKFSDFLYKADPNAPVRTIKASGGAYTGPFHWDNRFFKYEEYKRLQTIPDDYQISGAKQLAVKQIGNAVPPQLARILAAAIRQQVFGTRLPFELALLGDSEELTFRRRKRELTGIYRKRAEMAIRAMDSQAAALPDSRGYYCSLQDNFRLQETAPSAAGFRVRAAWEKDLTITVADPGGQAGDVIRIAVSPRDGSWTLGVSRVFLVVQTRAPLGFTAAWKAFERELADNAIKADLVQLNGYYQYEPKLVCTCEIDETLPFAGVIRSVVTGKDVGTLLTGGELARSWGLPEDAVMDAAGHLKALGYEVRNHATNPQIKEGDWLIPYAFPTLAPLSVQLGKRLQEEKGSEPMPDNSGEKHLDVYEDRYELHQGSETAIYYQGFQNRATQRRYARINQALADGYLEQKFASVQNVDFSGLSEENKSLLRNMVDGITSEVGRALAGLAFLQLTIKSIAPEQSIRLHKGTTRRGSFSWVEGISMRTIDSTYNTPFLREHGLLNLNKFGLFMTRSLAENYPYSSLYKAEMRGPFNEWIAIVDALERGTMPAELGLSYLMGLLQNRSDRFRTRAELACSLTAGFQQRPFDEIQALIAEFFNSTDYSARAFEVAMHGFFQAMQELHCLGEAKVVPMSQMRSANKKHGNVGDIELTEDQVIVEAWDAKYGKPYLRDELEELRDKLLTHPDVRVAGFVVDSPVDLRRDIASRKADLEAVTGTDIHLFSFDEWVDYETSGLDPAQRDALGYRWLVAVVESFAQRRPKAAPIDEPCDAWINDLIALMSR